jgi:hypothetical protein
MSGGLVFVYVALGIESLPGRNSTTPLGFSFNTGNVILEFDQIYTFLSLISEFPSFVGIT